MAEDDSRESAGVSGWPVGNLSWSGKSNLVETAAGGEFLVADSAVRLTANSRYDPLPHVAAEMEHQIAHRVFVIDVPHPDLLVVQPADALPNPGK